MLPPGLNLNSSTGLISGTPTALAAAANYTITASNSGGSSTAVVNINVKDVASNGCNYSTPIASYAVGSPIAQNSITCSGGAVTSYSIAPSLPAGQPSITR